MKKKIVVILAGGSGSRLWPYSRQNYPKQILKLLGENSLIQNTFLRFGNLIHKNNFRVVTNSQQKHLIEKDAEEILFYHEHLVIEEPLAKNTAGAIVLAALQLNAEDIMVVLPSDHIIASEEQFRKSIDRAQLLAEQGFLVTLGIKPEYPETGYGYIQAGKKLVEKEFEVKAFIEKPDFEKAKKLYEDKAFYWNSGIFIWKVSTIIDEFKSYKPQLHDSVKKYLDSGEEKYFAEIENISIDYAILEQSDKVAVVEADLKWSDLGSWRSVYDIQKKDNNGNVLNGNAINIESKNTFVQNTTDYRTVAVVGVNNVSVIDTDDAVIICDLNRTQDVKRVVDQLKDEKSEKLDHHRTVYRPWGYYKILEDLDHFKTKRLVIYPGQSISLQYHKKRNETWTIVSGTASVIRGEEQLELNVGETVYIPAGYNHRVTNNSKIDVELIEVQTGTYFGEDDIIRIDDQYNRI